MTGLDSHWSPPGFDGEPTVVRLSPMRADTLECLCRGLGNRAIGEQLLIAEDTVKSHVKAILQALGAHDRLHAVVLVLTGQVRIEVGHARPGRKPRSTPAGAVPHGVATQPGSASEAALLHPAGRSEP